MKKQKHWTHMVVENGRVVGMARDVVPEDDDYDRAHIELFGLANCAEFGLIQKNQLVEFQSWFQEA